MTAVNVIKAIKYFIKYGYKEIVLTGVNTAGYKDKNTDFYKLLLMLDKLKGDFRIRISSLEPFQINKKIINLFANNKKR
jgi:threonylcarbamoyladenosine tRNA methylthiotransferase MtaB